MITETMSWKEAHDEIMKDHTESNIEARWNGHYKAQNRLYTAAINSGKDKVMKPIIIKTKRFNTFYIVPHVQKKSNDKCLLYHETLVPVRYHGHLWIAAYRKSTETGEHYFTFYLHHLFCRYEERFNLNDEIPESFIKTATEFLIRNSEQRWKTINREDRKELFVIFGDGFALGELEDGIQICKTYVRYDMMHEDQRELYHTMQNAFELQQLRHKLYNPKKTPHGKYTPSK